MNSPVRITINAPHVPHGPEGMTYAAADSQYLMEAARSLEYRVERGEAPWGSNVTATVIGLLRNVAGAVFHTVEHDHLDDGSRYLDCVGCYAPTRDAESQ